MVTVNKFSLLKLNFKENLFREREYKAYISLLMEVNIKVILDKINLRE